jgi:hypothetical protein
VYGNSPENAGKVYRALAKFGAPLQKDGLSPADFAGKDLTYQIGVEPVRIDILTHISGVEFSDAWPNCVASIMFGVPVYFISPVRPDRQQEDGGPCQRCRTAGITSQRKEREQLGINAAGPALSHRHPLARGSSSWRTSECADTQVLGAPRRPGGPRDFRPLGGVKRNFF